ncbi:MAG: hypothetical protein BWX47_01997 [candidate division Hyd24-12 bacterium ADurb.Bin004]|nr:MAG: hypothetical protein BWX47_01997 [candidate division Hyd24-12 bacterium ADurb.Bin004]
MRSESPGPRKTTHARCSFSGFTKTFVSSISMPSSRADRAAQVSVGILPALRSETAPEASSVQKLARAAMSPGSMGNPMPSAERIPLPTKNSTGSYPNRAR